MSEEITIVVHVRTDRSGSLTERELTFDRAEWESMTSREKDEATRDIMFEMIDWGYGVKE